MRPPRMHTSAIDSPIRKVGSRWNFCLFMGLGFNRLSAWLRFSLEHSKNFFQNVPIRKLREMQTQLPSSTHQAQAILAAWQSGNVQTLGDELDRVSRIPVESADSMEEERMELLSAIASEWRLSRQPFGS